MISYSLPFFHPYISSFFIFFFSCILSTTHVYPSLVHPLIFFYFHLIPEAPSLFLSPALSFSTLFFFFFSFSTWFHKFSSSLCDTSHIILFAFWCHYLQTHTRHAWRERRNHLCSTTTPPLLLLLTAECMQPGVISASIFFPCSWLVVVSDFRFVKSASIFYFLIIYCSNFFFSVLDLLLLLFWF